MRYFASVIKGISVDRSSREFSAVEGACTVEHGTNN